MKNGAVSIFPREKDVGKIETAPFLRGNRVAPIFLRKLDIIFEDEYILVINKPAGLLVVPTPKKERHTLTSIVKAYPCHRLDRDTSGLIIFAKSQRVQEAMMRQFKARRVKKRYIAFIHGFLQRRHGIINKNIEGKFALTRFRVQKEDKRGFSVVEAQPLTGRTNQIRIHFKMLGHPLLGERKFAFGRDYELKFRRTALHAEGISFKHPVTGEYLSFSQPIAEDMRKFLEEGR